MVHTVAGGWHRPDRTATHQQRLQALRLSHSSPGTHSGWRLAQIRQDCHLPTAIASFEIVPQIVEKHFAFCDGYFPDTGCARCMWVKQNMTDTHHPPSPAISAHQHPFMQATRLSCGVNRGAHGGVIGERPHRLPCPHPPS